MSGSVDWIIEVFQKIAGLTLALHDPGRPDVAVRPNLPAPLDHELTLKRVIHQARPHGGFREVPITIHITKDGAELMEQPR